jgi:hypothetical protein
MGRFAEKDRSDGNATARRDQTGERNIGGIVDFDFCQFNFAQLAALK